MSPADSVDKKKYVTDYGGDGPVVILLHGFLASKGYWKKVQPHLTSAGYHVIALDLLGFGSAPKPKKSRYSYEEHIYHIQSALSYFTIDHPVILIGHSMGSLLAARYSVMFPEKVRHLVLINPPVYTSRAEVRKTLRNSGIVYRFLLDSRYRHVLWVILKRIGPFSDHTKYSREGSLKNVIEDTSLFADLDSVKTPTLMIVGKKDRQEYIINLRDALFDENIEVLYENVNHHAARRKPNLVANRVLQFLRGTSNEFSL
jgi:pimeloyl-ACP methyl ester carboxylesterase